MEEEGGGGVGALPSEHGPHGVGATPAPTDSPPRIAARTRVHQALQGGKALPEGGEEGVGGDDNQRGEGLVPGENRMRLKIVDTLRWSGAENVH